ncbi:class II aldolase/adducin family protein [Nocardia abscessus]|uniref:class II aldolase/adducin family protein n=1 Tax=Nocardia abscessus TaxID=120957 RepID=UPI003CC7DB9E
MPSLSIVRRSNDCTLLRILGRPRGKGTDSGFTETGDLIRTPAMGRAVARALGERNAVLLVNPGVVVTGTSIPEAVFAAVVLEKACRMQLAAAAASSATLRVSSDEEAIAKRGRVRRAPGTGRMELLAAPVAGFRRPNHLTRHRDARRAGAALDPHPAW